jgi:hypothetical protein
MVVLADEWIELWWQYLSRYIAARWPMEAQGEIMGNPSYSLRFVQDNELHMVLYLSTFHARLRCRLLHV